LLNNVHYAYNCLLICRSIINTKKTSKSNTNLYFIDSKNNYFWKVIFSQNRVAVTANYCKHMLAHIKCSTPRGLHLFTAADNTFFTSKIFKICSTWNDFLIFIFIFLVTIILWCFHTIFKTFTNEGVYSKWPFLRKWSYIRRSIKLKLTEIRCIKVQLGITINPRLTQLLWTELSLENREKEKGKR
jgi:hypothetical protein